MRNTMDLLTRPRRADNVHSAVSKMWDVSGPFPEPLFLVGCPGCASMDPIYRVARFFTKGNKDATVPWRCDVGMKCGVCSLTWDYGVVIPETMWRLHGSRKITYTRRMIRRYLEEEDDVS